jgi:hypothetical protein
MILATLAFQPVLAPSPAAAAAATTCQVRVDGSLRTVATTSALTTALGRTVTPAAAVVGFGQVGINSVPPSQPGTSGPGGDPPGTAAVCAWNGTPVENQFSAYDVQFSVSIVPWPTPQAAREQYEAKQLVPGLPNLAVSGLGDAAFLITPQDCGAQLDVLAGRYVFMVSLCVEPVLLATSPWLTVARVVLGNLAWSGQPTPPPPPSTPPTERDCTPVVQANTTIGDFPSFKLELKVALPSDLGSSVSAEAGFKGGASVCDSAFSAGDPTRPTSSNPVLSLSGTDTGGTGYGPFVYDVSQLAWTQTPGSPPGNFQTHFDLANVTPSITPNIDLSGGNPSLEIASVKLKVAGQIVTLVRQSKALLEADLGPTISIAADINAKDAASNAAKGESGGESPQTAETDTAEMDAGNVSVAVEDEIRALDPQADPAQLAKLMATNSEVSLDAALAADDAAISAAAVADTDAALTTSADAIGGDAGAATIDGALGDATVESFGVEDLLWLFL